LFIRLTPLLAKGTHYGSSGILPFIPGVDGVGRKEDGTRVYFGGSRSPYGTFAERASAPTPSFLSTSSMSRW
jgi:NADPH2:quinone reductase